MINLIVIEDNSLFRTTLVRLLESNGKFNCDNAFDSAETALKALDEGLREPEVVMLDIGLPGLSGIECIPKLKELCPETKIIMLTIHDDDDSIFKAVCAGAAGYLLKDSPSEKIVSAIDEVVNGGAPMNSHIAKRVMEMFKKLAIPAGNYSLTKREIEILQLLVDGLSKKQISGKLHISYHTVDTHIRHIYEKLEVNTRSGVVVKALRENLL